MRKTAYLFVAILMLFTANVGRGQTYWELVGGPGKGVTASAITSDGTLIVEESEEYGNLYYDLFSHDGGNSWVARKSQEPWLSVFRTPSGSLLTSYWTKSSDDGRTWQKFFDGGTLFFPPQPVAEAIDSDGSLCISVIHPGPNVPSKFTIDTVFDSVNGRWFTYYDTTFYHYDTAGIYRVDSNGNGQGFIPIFTSSGFDYYNSFVTTIAIGSDGSYYVGSTDGRILCSKDRITWTALPSLGSEVYSMSTGLNGNVFAATASDSVFRLDSDWTFILNVYANYPFSTVVDRAGTLFVLGTRLYRSTDDGHTWQALTFGATSLAMSFNANDDTLFASGYGFFRSTNDGQDWLNLGTGLGLISIGQLATSAKGIFFAINPAGVYGDDDYISSDNGNTWIAPQSYYSPTWDLTSADTSFFGIIVDNAIVKTSNNGASWDTVNSDVLNDLWSDVCGNLFVTTFPLDTLFYSSDLGNSWHHSQASFNGLPAISSFTSDSTCTDYMFSGNTLYRSLDGGASWAQEGSPIDLDVNSSRYVQALLSLGNGTIDVLTSENHILQTMDNAQTWHQQGILPANYVLSYTTTIVSFSNNLIVAGGGGVIRSTDQGVTWLNADSGIAVPSVSALAFSLNGELYAATGAGLYRSVNLSSAGVQPSSEQVPSIIVSQNSPNPFPQSTTISFTLPAASYISLNLFDATGREVARIASGYFNAGEHEVPFARGNLPAGVYFYRLEANGSIETRAMVME